MINLSNDEIESILDEVQGVLDSVTKSERQKAALAKAEGSAPDADDDGADAGPPAADVPPAADAGGPPADAAPPGGDPMADPAAAGADPAAGGDPAAAGAPTDPAALQAAYSKLPLDELKVHAEAAMAALQAAMGGAGGAPPAGPPDMGGAPGAGAPPPMAPAMKKEMKVEGNGGEVVAAKKSEKEISDLKKSLAEQGETLLKVTEAFTRFVSKPMRKAETALTPKGPVDGPKLSKSEVQTKLRAKIQDKSLSKKDRELINNVFLNQMAHDDKSLAHLLS